MQTVTFDDDLAPGSTAVFSIDLYATTNASIGSDTVAIAWSSGGGSDNTTVPTTVRDAQLILATSGTDGLKVGDTGTFQLTVSNAGLGSAFSVTIDPAGFNADLAFNAWQSLPVGATVNGSGVVTLPFIAGSGSSVLTFTADATGCDDFPAR